MTSLTNGRKLLSMVAALVLCLACVGALAGCAAGEEATDAAAQNRAYMSQANTAMMQLNADLEPFTEAAATGDVVTMEQAAAAAYRDIEAFGQIEAPDAMKDIHAEYVAGCNDLKQALQEYIKLYGEAPGLEDGDLNARVADVQKRYDSGIAHLQEGDRLVTELTGALPSESSSSSGD